MGRQSENNEAKKFSESVDKIIAGEQVDLPAPGTDELEVTVAFARKLVERRVSARPSFKANLKERLLSRLSEEEKMTFREVTGDTFWQALRRLVSRTPVWQTVVAVLVVTLVGGILWGTGILSPTTHTPGITTVPLMPLQITATPSQPAYLPGEEVRVELSFTNVSSKPITISPIPPEVDIVSTSKQLLVRSLGAGAAFLKLEAGESATHTLVWDQRDSTGQQVAPGHYDFDIKDIQIVGTDIGVTGLRPGSITSLLIRSAPGAALEKTVEVNQTVSRGGITVTLKRVELSATGGKVYAFARRSEAGTTQELVPMMVAQAFAQYRVGNGEMRQAEGTGSAPSESGVEIVWDKIDPVPIGSETFFFVIVSLDEQAGPWEFEIPLR